MQDISMYWCTDVSMYLQAYISKLIVSTSWWRLGVSIWTWECKPWQAHISTNGAKGFQRAPLFQIGWKTNKIAVSCFIKTSQFIHRYVSVYIYIGYHVVLCYLTLHYIYILHYIDYVIHIDTYDIYI